MQDTDKTVYSNNSVNPNVVNGKKPKKNRSGQEKIVIAICWIVGIIVLIGLLFGNDDDKDESQQADSQATTQVAQTQQTNNTSATWQNDYKKKDIQYVGIKFLTKNSDKYGGKVVASVGKIHEKDESLIRFDTDKSNYFIEIDCNMKNPSEITSLNKGDKVCFIGKVGDTSTYFGNDTVDINDCYILATGSGVSEYEKKIKDNESKQKEFVKNAKDKAKKQEKKQAQNEKDSYRSSCKTYSYDKIKRNPDKYKGKKIKMTGKVVQVEEGWFGTVALRVEDSNGNDWYISYSYKDGEDKILENDSVSVYGECAGTEQYETILGDTRRIPSIDAEYID